MGKLTDTMRAVFGSAGFTQGDRVGQLVTDINVYDPIIARNLIDGLTIGDLYATQPALRSVVSFVARNGAQLGRHVYTKQSNGDRKRATTGSAVDVLAKPNDYMSGYDLFNMLLTELALYDFALWVPRLTKDGTWAIDPIPNTWIVGVKSGDAFRAEAYKIQPPNARDWYFVMASDAVVFRGYSATGFKSGSSAVVSLRSTLSEQVSAMSFREQMWQRGGRVGMFMTRPAAAPVWSAEAKSKFVQQWKSSWAGNGANAGSTPLLEDGMELKRVGFNAKEEQWLEAATLSLATVANAYHVPPAMVGVSGYNSFASVKEFRKMLYTETMGPTIAQVEDTINTFLFPLIDAPKGQYLELNINEKLQGDFAEQAEQLFKAVGGPYMMIAEARKFMNLPIVEGSDVLLAPLNMGAVGNNGPTADAPIDPGATESDAPTDNTPKANGVTSAGLVNGYKAPGNLAPTYAQDSLEISLRAFFGRQAKAVLAQIDSGKKADANWWNQKAWNQELSSVLLPHMTSISAGVARKAAGAKGLDPDLYSEGRTAAFLKAVADSRADLINATTRDAVQEAIVTEGKSASDVFIVAQDSRAKQSATTMSTMLAGWAVTEMARQLLADKGPKKTWVSSGLPDSRHTSMNGETVGIDSKFSNGANWPGDPVLGAKGVSNCACGVDITY